MYESGSVGVLSLNATLDSSRRMAAEDKLHNHLQGGLRVEKTVA